MSRQRILIAVPLRPRLVLPLVALVGLLGLLLCSRTGTARLAPVPTDAPAELRLLTPETFYFMHIRAQDLLSRPLVKQLLPLLPFSPDNTLDDVTLESLGTKLSDLDSVAFFGPNRQECIGVTVRKAVDRDRVLQTLAPGSREHTIKGKTIHVAQPRVRFNEKEKPLPAPGRDIVPYAQAVHFLDGRTYLIGRVAVLEQLFDKGGKPDEKHRLHAVLNQAGRHHLTLGMALTDEVREELRELFGEGRDPLTMMAQGALRPLLNARHFVLTADLGEESRIDVAAQFNDARSAMKGRDALRFALALNKTGSALLEEETVDAFGGPEKMKDAKLLPFFASYRQALDDAVVKVEENAVKVSVRLKTDSDTLKAVLVDTLPRVQIVSQRMAALGNLRQIGVAFHNYHDATGTMPAAAIYSRDGKPLFSWRVALLPYLEQNNLHKKLKLDEPWDSEHNKKVLAEVKMPKVYELPGVDAGKNKTFLQVFSGNNTPFNGPNGLRFANFTDGLSNTLLVVEADEAVHWAAPQEIAFAPRVSPLKQLGKNYGKGTLAVFGDGSVRTIPTTATEQDVRAAVTPNGGEVIGRSLYGDDDHRHGRGRSKDKAAFTSPARFSK